MALTVFGEAVLGELGVNQLAHEGRGERVDAGGGDLLLDLERDGLGCVLLEAGLAGEGANNAASIPCGEGVGAGAH